MLFDRLLSNATNGSTTDLSISMEVMQLLSFGAPFAVVNTFTLTIIMVNKNLRKPSNYSIGSFLLASIFHSLLASPGDFFWDAILRTYHVRSTSICNIYRISYFFFAHVMKASLLIDSVNRVLSIRWPYAYQQRGKTINAVVLPVVWLMILAIDLVPFFLRAEQRNDMVLHGMKCTHIPTRSWSISVIILFDVLPFVIMAVNYITIWRQAAVCALNDQTQSARSCSNASRLSSSTVKSLRFIAELKATKTSVLLLLAYLVCWGPLSLYYFIENCCLSTEGSVAKESIRHVKFAIKVMSFLSDIVGSIVYCWRTKEFQNEVQKMFCKNKYHRKVVQNTSSSISMYK